MKPHKMNERLERIARNMKDLPIKGTTRIAWSCLTKREKLLYDKTALIAQKLRRARRFMILLSSFS